MVRKNKKGRSFIERPLVLFINSIILLSANIGFFQT